MISTQALFESSTFDIMPEDLLTFLKTFKWKDFSESSTDLKNTTFWIKNLKSRVKEKDDELFKYQQQTLQKIIKENMVVVWTGASGDTLWYSSKNGYLYSYSHELNLFFEIHTPQYLKPSTISKLHYKQWIIKSKTGWEMV